MKPFVKIIREDYKKESIGVTHYGYLRVDIDWDKGTVVFSESTSEPFLTKIKHWLLRKFMVNCGWIMVERKSGRLYKDGVVYVPKDSDKLYKNGVKNWKTGRTNLSGKTYED